jgi:hypothetical protein
MNDGPGSGQKVAILREADPYESLRDIRDGLTRRERIVLHASRSLSSASADGSVLMATSRPSFESVAR